MGKLEVPMPPPQKRIRQDRREKRLQGWKALFESLHPDIRVILSGEDGFSKSVDDALDGVSCGYHQKQRIFVHLPASLFPRHEFLIGHEYIGMYSAIEVDADPLKGEGIPPWPLQPELKPWKYFYHELDAVLAKALRQIPRPPAAKKK